MVNKLSVEVKKQGGLFEALIIDVEREDGTSLKVAYKGNCFPAEVVPAVDVKLPANVKITSYREGQLVEVYFKRQDGLAWWPAFVHQVFPDNKTCLVRFEDSYITQTITWDNIRMLNLNSQIECVSKIVVQVPFQFRKQEHISDVLQKFQLHFYFPCCEYLPEENTVKIIYFQRSQTVTNAKLVNYLLTLYDEIDGEDDTESNYEYLDENDTSSTADEQETSGDEKSVRNFKETFIVPKFLIGLALGPNGENINLVRTLDCISKVKFNGLNNRFFICGESKEIVKIARNLLEYTTRRIKVPRDIASILQKDDGKLLQRIVYDTGLVRIEVDNMEYRPQSDNINFTLIGTKSSVSEAQSRIETDIACLKEMKKVTRSAGTIKSKPEPPEQSPFKKSVQVSNELVGMVLGKNGANIKIAKEIPGVHRIEEKDTPSYSVFTVHGETEKAVRKAASKLELVRDTSCWVEPGDVGKLIGKNGFNIKKAIAESGLLRLDVKDKPEDLTTYSRRARIEMLGNREQIRKAKEHLKSTFQFVSEN